MPDASAASAVQERISCLVENAIAGLRQALDTRPSRRIVLVGDPTVADPFMATVQESGLASTAVSIPRTINLAVAPYLVEIEDEARLERFVNASLRLAVEQALQPAPADRRARSVCAWLLTQESTASIANAFVVRMRIRDDSGEPRVLRFWDPRTTQHMATLFPGRPPASWLQHADWGYIDAFGLWSLLPAGALPEERPHWSALQLLSWTNAVQQHLATNGLEHAPAVLAQIETSLKAALRAGLEHETDLICFAEQRVRLQSAIEHAPLIKQAIEEASETGGRYHKVAETFDDADWAAVVQYGAAGAASNKGQEAFP